MNKIRFVLAVMILPLVAASSGAVDFDTLALERLKNPPLGLPRVQFMSGGQPTRKKIALGRKLFFDRRLSRNGTMSCAMCHIPEQGFTNNELATPIGVEGRSLKRNAPTILNSAYQRSMFHDARDTSLETQVFGPLLSANEMDNPSAGWLVQTIKGLEDYWGLFEKAFGEPANIRNIGQAIAHWERTLLSANSSFDRWYYGGDETAIGKPARRGFKLFTGKANCASCHLIGNRHALFTDHRLHNTGTGYIGDVLRPRKTGPVNIEIAPGMKVPLSRKAVDDVDEGHLKDLGRMEVTGSPRDLYRFKTPSLRNIALTAPYMHDGSFTTLRQVVEFYNRGAPKASNADPRIKPLGLSSAEMADLVAFLESLTGDNIALLIRDARSAGTGN